MPWKRRVPMFNMVNTNRNLNYNSSVFPAWTYIFWLMGTLIKSQNTLSRHTSGQASHFWRMPESSQNNNLLGFVS